jgi:hypothetical protein
MKWSSVPAKVLRGGLGSTLLLYIAVLSITFYGVFIPGQTLFSNDGPLGELMTKAHQLPSRYFGCWADLNSVGFNASAASPGISFGLQWLLGPVFFSKFYALVSLLIVGVGAWSLLHELRLSPLACVLGGLAAMLNSTCFSVACWGVGGHDLTIGMSFLAMAAVADPTARLYWLRLILAGFAVGMGVIEGADVGAIFSLFVAAFMIYQTWTIEGSWVKNAVLGIGRLTLVVVCAVFLASQSIQGLVSTSIEGVTGTQQDIQTKADRWDWATQWSLPKRELLTLVVPGLFGYRMDTPGGGNYWGMMGRSPSWNKYIANGSQGTPPTSFIRYTGGGNYAGVLIVLLAVWAATESLRRKASVFSVGQRKWVWFWSGVAVLSVMLALGRYAPFYHYFYLLPYVSTIRNPTKFLYLFGFGLAMLFAFAIDGLERRYMQPAGPQVAGRWAGLSGWWRKAARFEKFWFYGCGLVLVVSLLGWKEYSQHHDDLVQYLGSVRIVTLADSVATFSIQQVGWFILFFFLAAGLLVLIFSGAFAGKRTVWGAFFLGLLLLADMGLANRPWIIYWDYQDKYASNPIIDRLRDQPYEHRVALAPINLQSSLAVLRQVYRIQWLQHQFPYYNIQSFDVVEMPRMPVDFSAFLKMFTQSGQTNSMFRQVRAWQLTNTRYIMAPANFEVLWDDQDYLAQTPLQTVGLFDIVHKPGVVIATNPEQLTALPVADGHFGLFEFTGALPRAKLYSNWQVNANDTNALNEIFSPEFDPVSSVVVDSGMLTNSPTGATGAAANGSSDTVDFASYAPKDLVFKANPSSASVLLLNDHFDPNWKVFVDGSPEKLLRCNYLMRGVYLLPGAHTVEFKFLPPVGLLYVSATAVILGLLGLGFLLVYVYKNRPVAQPVAVPPPSAQIENRPRKPEPKKKANPPAERKSKTK